MASSWPGLIGNDSGVFGNMSWEFDYCLLPNDIQILIYKEHMRLKLQICEGHILGLVMKIQVACRQNYF